MKNIKVGDKVRFIGGNPKNKHQRLNNDGNAELKVGEVYTVRAVDEDAIKVNEDRYTLWYNIAQFEPVIDDIKDLKLIIGPLNTEQWKEVTAWCDETSICRYKFAKANINPTIFVRYTYHHTDQDNYYDSEYSSHENLTYQQWYNRFIKKDVKQNEEEIMNKKEPFTIEGTLALKRAFVEEVNIPKSNYWIDKNYICNSEFEGKLGTCAYKEDTHFILPQDWAKALEYVKDYFKEEPKFKVGDYIYFINQIESVSPKGSVGKITNIGKGNKPWISYSTKFGTGAFEIESYTNKGSFRLATPEEIKSVQTKTLVLGDKKIKVEISRKNIIADGKIIRVAELYKILGIMSTSTILDGTNWIVSYPNVQIGCTTLSLDEVKLIKKTYEELND